MVQKRKTVIKRTTFIVARKCHVDFIWPGVRNVLLPCSSTYQSDRTTRAVENCLSPVTTQCLLTGFFSWKGLLSVLSMMPRSVLQFYWCHTEVLKSFPKPGTCLQLDLKVWRNVCRRWTVAFGANCSCFVWYQLVLKQARLYLSHHITKLQEVLVRDFLRGKFYQACCVQGTGLLLRHCVCFSSTFFLVVLYSLSHLNLKAEESGSVCCLPAFPHTHLFYQCSVTNYRFLRMQFSRYWNTLRYFSVLFCSLFLKILNAELLIKLTDE